VKASSGRCLSCSQDLPVNQMVRHLQECSLISRQKATGRLFLIKATAKYNPAYWLFIESDCSSSLEKLDGILRATWLECCGHLSCFTIDDKEYHIHPDSGFGEKHKDMKIRLDKVLTAGTSFNHEYDFGTTTELTLKVISQYDGKIKDNVRVLAINNPPAFKCTSCGHDATMVCSACHFNEGEDDGILCKKCLENHECGEEMGTPIVNSPRTGMCGYEG
jgi:hypothetical protein